MAQLDLRVRNLETRETLIATFENPPEALLWLMQRPRWIEVLGVATPGLPREVYPLLRTAARPLDDEERAAAERLDAADEEASRQAEAAARRRDEEDLAAYRQEQLHADPDRPLHIQWTLEAGMRLADPYDPREITPVARAAVQAWLAEREEWVRDRGQVVGEATLTVWPGPLPPGSARVEPGGQFVPVPRPEPA